MYNIGFIHQPTPNKGLLSFSKMDSHKNDALNADTSDEMMAFNSCFIFFIFLLKNSKVQSFKEQHLVSAWKNSFEGFMSSLDIQSPCIIKAGLENVNHLLQWTTWFKDDSWYFLLNAVLFLLVVLESSVVSLLCLFLFWKKLSSDVCFYSFGARIHL